MVPVGVLRQPLDLEQLGRLEEGGEVGLGHVDLAHVDELEDGVEVNKRDITQEEDGVLPAGNTCKMNTLIFIFFFQNDLQNRFKEGQFKTKSNT